ncbi:MAG: hypothetical protein J6U17_03580 [Kiritimatiellae bacterium]|nr:hypothetical protein [Kiritimatiellia bacterium]
MKHIVQVAALLVGMASASSAFAWTCQKCYMGNVSEEAKFCPGCGEMKPVPVAKPVSAPVRTSYVAPSGSPGRQKLTALRKARWNSTEPRGATPFKLTLLAPSTGLGIFGDPRMAVYGLDLGVFGSETEEAWGISSAGLFNMAHEVYGLKTGVVNTDEIMYGFHVGVFNVGYEVKGFQIGGWNFATKEGAGFQIGAINYANDMSGIQIGGINSASSMAGLQIGAINFADHMKGIQLGAFNIIADLKVPFLPVFNMHF